MRVITTEVEAKMVAARLNSKGVGDADIATVSAAISYVLPHFTCMQQLTAAPTATINTTLLLANFSIHPTAEIFIN